MVQIAEGLGREGGAAPGAAPGARFALTADEWKAWTQDGFFARPRVFDAEEVAALAEAAEAVVALAARGVEESREHYDIDGNHYAEVVLGLHRATVQLEHAPSSATLRVIEPFHGLHPRFEALVDDPRLVEPMRALVGSPGVALFTDKLNLKRPREGSRFDWHQDSPYWAHFCDHLDQLPNVLVALDDADTENGCFRVIRGSHRRGMLPGRTGQGVLGPLFTDRRYVDESLQVPAELPAGSAVFFSPHTVHGSEPNRSPRPRRAFVLTYQPAGLRMFKVDAVRNVGVAEDARPE